MDVSVQLRMISNNFLSLIAILCLAYKGRLRVNTNIANLSKYVHIDIVPNTKYAVKIIILQNPHFVISFNCQSIV